MDTTYCSEHNKQAAVAYCPKESVFYCGLCFSKHNTHGSLSTLEFATQLKQQLAQLHQLIALTIKYRLLTDDLFQSILNQLNHKSKLLLSQLSKLPKPDNDLSKKLIDGKHERILSEMASHIRKELASIQNFDSLSNLSNSILHFDQSHSHADMSVFNNGLSVNRIKGGKADVPINGDICITKGIATWKVKIDKKSNHVGMGIHSNNTDDTCYEEYFIFSNGAKYGFSEGGYEYKEGDELSLCLDMNKRSFTMVVPSGTSSCQVSGSQYYPFFEIYGIGDQISIISSELKL